MLMRATALAASIFAAGCVAAPTIETTFNPAEAAFINETGSGTISGQAFLRRNDGVVVYAAGSEVHLVPKSTYADERIQALYRGGKFNGYVPAPKNTDPQYLAMTKTTKANGEGRFSFENLADGDYYVLTQVTWLAGDIRQGGSLMEPVSIRNGRSVDIIMTGK